VNDAEEGRMNLRITVIVGSDDEWNYEIYEPSSLRYNKLLAR